MEVLSNAWFGFTSFFWNGKFWLPVGTTWSMLESTPDAKYPNVSDLWYPFGFAVLLLIVRFCFEWIVARPLGVYLGIQDTHSELQVWQTKVQRIFTPAANGDCNTDNGAVVANGSVDSSKQSILNSNGVAATRRQRRHHRINLVAHKSKLDKFSECAWRGFFYAIIWVYGLSVLWTKPWMVQTSACWNAWPLQTIDTDVWYYYMIEAGFYWSLAFSQFVDVCRKDFWINFIHHIATILLLYLSWICNFVRIGTLVIIIHDSADTLLESAKMAKYSDHERTCTALFIVFIPVWFFTRLYLFPYYIMYACLVEAVTLVGFSGAYWVFNSLLSTLLVLHCIWSFMIVQAVSKTIFGGQKLDDVRSDDESSDHEDIKID